MASDASVSAVFAIKNPEIETLAWTLDRLAEQTHPPMEAVIVDSSSPPIDAEVDSYPVRVLNRPNMGIGEARREGIRYARGDHVLHMDEDAVLLRDDYIESALASIQSPDVAAAGGVVYPLRETAEGKTIALLDRFNPTTMGTHYLLHPKALCSGGRCSPVDGRGEDIPHRRQVSRFGRTERMTEQGVLKDLPTTRQRIARDILVASVSGVVSGALTGYLTDVLGVASSPR